MKNNIKHILMLFLITLQITAWGQQGIFSKNSFGLQIEVGGNTTMIPTRKNLVAFTASDGWKFEELKTSPTVTLGLEGRAAFHLIENKFFGYNFFGEISKGWLFHATNTSNAYGHSFYIGIKDKFTLVGEISKHQRTPIILEEDFLAVSTDLKRTWGRSEFENIRRHQIGIKIKGITLAVFRERFTLTETDIRESIGYKVSIEFKNKQNLYLEFMDTHPIYGNISSLATGQIDGDELQKKGIFAKISYRVPFSVMKTYGQALK